MPELEAGKQLVQRLVTEVMSQRRLEILDEIYGPRLAPAAHRWTGAFLSSFSDVEMRTDTWSRLRQLGLTDASPARERDRTT